MLNYFLIISERDAFRIVREVAIAPLQPYLSEYRIRTLAGQVDINLISSSARQQDSALHLAYRNVKVNITITDVLDVPM